MTIAICSLKFVIFCQHKYMTTALPLLFSHAISCFKFWFPFPDTHTSKRYDRKKGAWSWKGDVLEVPKGVGGRESGRHDKNTFYLCVELSKTKWKNKYKYLISYHSMFLIKFSLVSHHHFTKISCHAYDGYQESVFNLFLTGK